MQVNHPDGVPFKSSGFRGRLLFLHRADEDLPACPAEIPRGATPEATGGDGAGSASEGGSVSSFDGAHYAEHFRPRERRFELRVQGVFTIDPGDPDGLFFAAELAETVGLRPVMESAVSWLLSIARMLSTARGVVFACNQELSEGPDGDILRPHIAFPMLAADAIVVTEPGEEPPPITESLEKTPLAEKKGVCLNTKDTFTFGYWSKYVDFVRWEVCNMPLGWRSSFANFIGAQRLHLVCYRLKAATGEVTHADSNKQYLLRLTLASEENRPEEPGGCDDVNGAGSVDPEEGQNSGQAIIDGPGDPARRSGSWFF